MIVNVSSMPLTDYEQYVVPFLTYLKLERALSDNTIRAYKRDLNLLIDFLDERQLSIRLPFINTQTIREFTTVRGAAVSARTQARNLSSIRAFFYYQLLEKRIETDPTELIELPKITKKLPVYLSLAEVNNLVKSVDRSTLEGERNYMIIELLYGGGFRVSEIIAIRQSDLFLEDGFVQVTGKGNKQRFVPISDYTIKLINHYLSQVRNHFTDVKGFTDLLFVNRLGKQLTRAMIFHVIKTQASKAGIRKKIGPHTLRHTFATHLLSNGADLRSIQLMMGHENLSTTEIYVHVDRKQLAEVLDKYHPFANS